MRHAKVDRDHAALIATARTLGWSAVSLAAVGNGCPDCLLAHRSHGMLLIEFKTGKTGTLTPAQKRFHAAWRGPVAIIRTVDDLLALLASTRS